MYNPTLLFPLMHVKQTAYRLHLPIDIGDNGDTDL